jgi:transposase
VVVCAEPDITLQALSDRLLGERRVKADTSMLSRFLRSEDISFKKKRSAQLADSDGTRPCIPT